MIKNMSNTDRSFRIVAAVLFAFLYFGGIVTGTLGIALMAFSGVFILTSSIAFCPLYTLFNFSTRKKT